MMHPLARQFEEVAEPYDRGRPGYPPEAIALIARELGLAAGDSVLDLGAGTGKLTRALAEGGFDVLAVEPLDAMRARISAAAPGARVVSGTAEALPVADGAIAACCCADAFHWFDADAAASELHRAIRPGGGVALLWHLPGWEADAPAWWPELVALLDGLRGEHPGFTGEQGREGFARHGGFSEFAHHVVRSARRSDRAGVLAYVASISYVNAHPDRERVLADVAELLRDVEPHDNPLRCDVWLTRRRP